MTDKPKETEEISVENTPPDDQSSFRDHFLIALPNLAGDYFANTITYILEHNANGAFGLVINKPLQLTLSDLFGEDNFEGLDSNRTPVFDGGPVRHESVFFLHEAGMEYQFTQQISNDISLTTSEDLIRALAQGKGPSKIITAMGYAGWDNGQLERELTDNVWLLAPARAEIIFDTPCEERAQKAAALLGIDLNLVSSNAGHG
ncbi:MAG: YqgE/AlgH family protein [Pseudomonadales bacterium]|mgnify:CR=1 FL=1|jgi:putative transcriptional regulator|nr:YqgE/AlgH family protein [Pseudomonadales bacterium]MDP7146273.1 YqgE/AlgH family protein [Pseudomonadales bacterium]MDP7359065.1 YqgE/AlgH family protein [Pseudomonadales bacterium]HJN52140.1 YqgE/AlgH family protein [Pseudomonadales bacterium]|tara:strand:- start:105 stop:713 length:609 start_codon:yes stop_codon:yes gene_type:complete